MLPYDFSTRLSAATFVVLDFETTGLDAAAGARIIEIGALKVAGGKVAGHFQTLVNPQMPVPADASAVHGLTDADLADKPTLAETFPRFFSFVGDAVIVAYNLKFDLSFYARAARELGLPYGRNATVDLLGLARHYVPGLESYNLENLASRFNFTNPYPHRALGDVAVESEILLTFLEMAAARADAFTVGDFVLISRALKANQAAPETLVWLEWAIAAGETVEIIYGAAGETTRRAITPLFIRTREEFPTLTAFCHVRQAKRSFRLDRITLPPERAAPF